MGGVPDAPQRRVKIDLPEAYGRRGDDSVWDELEKYLFQGFLTATTHVAGKFFVFKTLNALELRNIDFMRPTRASGPEARDSFQCAMLAYSVFMADGVNALHDRPRHLHRLARVFTKVPHNVRAVMIENLAALNARASRLYPLVEVYAHEPRSRFRWMQVRDVPVHSPLATGIPGTDSLGMSTSQAMWTAINRLLDRREEMERDWSNAKFIGSCFAGKGVRSVDERDRARAERERVERDELKIKVLHDYLNRSATGKPEEETVDLPDGRKAVVVRGNSSDGKWRADSAEELRDQLEAALSGEKDHHDLVIEAKERQLAERARAMEAERSLVFRAPAPASQVAGGGSMVMGREEADKYAARMQALREEQIRRIGRMERAQESSDGDPEDGGPERG